MKKTSELDRAVVIGGSIAGLLAARVLSEFYREVVVVDRDELSKEGEYRRCVPQGRHAHALLAGGLDVLEELLPGLADEMISQGAVPCDALSDGRWFFEGGDLVRCRSGARSILMSRPMLEDGVRRRIRAIDSVSILDKRSVRGLIASEHRVEGVRTDVETIEADLVVDAAGRGSKAPEWLEALGYHAPREEKVAVQLVYTTRVFRREDTHINGDAFVVVPPTPEGKRGGVALAKEDNEWIVTLYGYFGQEAPEDLSLFIDYAATLPAKYIHELIIDAEPLGDAKVMRYPASVRNRYEHLKQIPEGFIAFGDAICSFNPIYGQGMSSAALQALELRRALRDAGDDLAPRFYRAAAKVIDNPWSIAVGSDLNMPETQAHRGLSTRIINWYMSQVHKRGHHHTDAAIAFIRVAQLMDSPPAVMRPALAVRVMWSLICRILSLSDDKPHARMPSTESSPRVHTTGF